MMTRSHYDRRAFLDHKRPVSVRAYGRNLYEHNRVSGTLCAISQIKKRKPTDIKIISVDRQRVNTILIVAILSDTAAVLSLDHACCLTMVLPFFRPLLQIICRCEVIVISTFTCIFGQSLDTAFRTEYYTALE
ncbi:uncharacterized protein ARMOST_18497 [Armillaria ostoyae]|uniref:Uncharacterized protein n=1 Tax=Armillaria ostoyae TaxID=47428 RepID=A0A284S1Z3_ARMOS|nr:uncharacterized protein ARMOST_18497 [Armillaria ostoyae]